MPLQFVSPTIRIPFGRPEGTNKPQRRKGGWWSMGWTPLTAVLRLPSCWAFSGNATAQFPAGERSTLRYLIPEGVGLPDSTQFRASQRG